MSSARFDKYSCPLCGESVRISKDGNLYCAGYKEGCTFGVHKNIAGKRLTQTQMLMLISSGRTNVIKGFVSKTGKPFDAALSLDKTTGKLNFLFSHDK